MAFVALVVFAGCTSHIAALRASHEATNGEEVAVNRSSEGGTYNEGCTRWQVQKENLALYGHKLHTELCDKYKGCPWWDDCGLYEGECPRYCTPWREFQPSKTLRTYQWAEHKINGQCPRVCRWNDEHMVSPGPSEGYMASSTAFLSVEAPKLQNCTTFSLSCSNKLAEIASVVGMVSRAIEKASEMAKVGRVESCQSILPGSLAEEIGESIVHLLKYLERLGAEKVDAQIEVVRKTFSAKTWAEICEGSMQAPSDLKMSEENMTKLILKASNGTMTEAQAAARAHAVQTKGVKAVADEILVEQEKALAQPEGGSLMQVDGQMEGIFNGLTYLVAAIVARVIWSASWGVMMTIFCVMSVGMATDDYVRLNAAQTMLWPLACPVQILRHGWLDDRAMRDELGMRLDWRDVRRAFSD